MTAPAALSDRWLAREDNAALLLDGAARHSYDPDRDIDWDAPPVPGLLYAPERQLSLYGTPLWDGLTREQQVELSKHEVASIACTGVWFEMILMQMLLRHAYDRDLATAHVRWTLTEIADECRHSSMFGRMVQVTGCPSYGPGPGVRLLGKVCKTVSDSALTFGGTLYVEELLDGLQRAAVKDESVQPLARAVSKVHVVEESRHIRFAREEIRSRAATLTRRQRSVARLELALVAYFATRALVAPQVYASVGLDVPTAVRTAKANPHWRDAKRDAAKRVIPLLEECGLIGGPSRWLWRKADLVD